MVVGVVVPGSISCDRDSQEFHPRQPPPGLMWRCFCVAGLNWHWYFWKTRGIFWYGILFSGWIVKVCLTGHTVLVFFWLSGNVLLQIVSDPARWAKNLDLECVVYCSCTGVPPWHGPRLTPSDSMPIHLSAREDLVTDGGMRSTHYIQRIKVAVRTIQQQKCTCKIIIINLSFSF